MGGRGVGEMQPKVNRSDIKRQRKRAAFRDSGIVIPIPTRLIGDPAWWFNMSDCRVLIGYCAECKGYHPDMIDTDDELLTLVAALIADGHADAAIALMELHSP